MKIEINIKELLKKNPLIAATFLVSCLSYVNLAKIVEISQDELDYMKNFKKEMTKQKKLNKEHKIGKNL